jgi:hypothetical protein
MPSINFYTPIGQALLGKTQKIAPFKAPTRGGPLAPGAWEFGRRVVPQWLAALEKRKDKKSKAAILAALVGDKYEYDPNKAAESFTPSQYLETQRAALSDQAQAQPERVSALDLSPDDLYSPDILPPSQPDDLYSPDILKPEELIAQPPSPEIEALFGSDPTTSAAMQAALIATPEEELEAWAGSPEERAGQERTYTETVHSPEAVRARMAALDPKIKEHPAFMQFQMSDLARKQRLRDEETERGRAAELAKLEHTRALEVKGTGPPVKPTVSIKAVADPNSGTGWSFKNVLDPSSPFLGEAQSQEARFDPDAPRKQKAQTLTDERYTEATTGLDEADTMLANIDQMRGLAQSTQTGPLTSFLTDLKSMANKFGMSFDPGEIANVEAMRAVGMKFILDIISKTKGAISEREMAAFEKASPGAGITKLGNKQILDLAEAAAERLTAAHQAVRDAYRLDGAQRNDLDDAFLKSKEEWGGFGFIFAPKDLTPEENAGWSDLTWQEKKEWYDIDPELSY